MPEPVTFFIRNIMIGFALAAFFVALLLFFDVNGLHSMLLKDDMKYLALLILWFGNGTVFGAVQVAWAVMSMKEKDDS